MLFEIINPSDTYTVLAPDLEIAGVACCLLGNGQYAFQGIDCDGEVPLFLFGGHDEWFTKHFGSDFETITGKVMSSRRAELADCFDSVLIGDAAHRKAFDKGLELIDDPVKREHWREHWLDERRTSMNNIGGRAWGLAKRLRDPAPEQSEKG